MARIALYGAGGSPYNHAALFRAAGHETSFVFPVDVTAGALEDVDVFVMPGGGYRAMQGQLDPLGVEGCRAVRAFVTNGGMYIGSCAGSYDAATAPDAFVRQCPAQLDLRLVDAKVWNDGTSTLGVIQSPGIGEVLVDNVAPDHPVMAGMPARFAITHYNGPFFVGGHSLADVVGHTDRFTAAEDFLGGSDDRPLIEDAVGAGVSDIVVDEVGAGRVVLFGSHPEFGTTVALDDVSVASTMLHNALSWQLAAQPARTHVPAVVLATAAPIPTEQVEADLAALPETERLIAVRCQELSRLDTTRSWLSGTQAMSVQGLSSLQIWQTALAQIPDLTHEAVSHAAELSDSDLSFRPRPEWTVDGGYWGVAPLLEQVADLLERALQAADGDFPASNAYDRMLDSPYHLVAGSYLAAIGRAASAAQLARTPAKAVQHS